MSEDNWFARGFLYAMRIHVGDFRRDDDRIRKAFRSSMLVPANEAADDYDSVFGTFEGLTKILLDGTRDFILRIDATDASEWADKGVGEIIRFRISAATAGEGMRKIYGTIPNHMRELATSLKDLALPVTVTKNDHLARRVDRIEAILRQAKLHEPGCPGDPKPLSAGQGETFTVYCPPRPCTCWLSKP